MNRPSLWTRIARASVVTSLLLVVSGSARAMDKGQRASDFEAATLDGGTLRLSSLRGKVVLLDFWASWCEPCKKELPLLSQMARRLKAQGIEIVTVNIDSKRENLDEFLKSHKVGLTVLLDPDGKVAGKYDPPTMPTSFVLDQSGVVRQVNAGFDVGDEKKIEGQLVSLAK